MSNTFRGHNMVNFMVTITQDRYDDLREAEKYAFETKRDNYSAERLKELERMYAELKYAVEPSMSSFIREKDHSEVVAMARMMRERVNEAIRE